MLKKYKWAFRLAAIAVLAILTACSYFYLRERSQNSLLIQAASYLEAGDLENTLRLAHKVYQRDPASIQSNRMISKALERINPRLALPWWERTVELNPQDHEANIRVLLLKLNTGSFEEIQKLIDRSPGSLREQSSYNEIVAMAYLHYGKYDLAYKAFAQAIELNPNNDDAKMARLLLESQSTDTLLSRAAIDKIHQLTKKHENAPDALFNLLTSNLKQTLEDSQYIEYTDQFLGLGEQDFSRNVEVVIAGAKRIPQERDRWFIQIETELIDAPAKLAFYGNALNQAGLSARVLELHERFETLSLEHLEIYDVYLDALLMEERYEEALKWLNKIPVESRSPWHIVMQRALELKQNWKLLDRRTIELELNQAGDLHQLSVMLNKTELHQWDTFQEVILWKLAENSGNETLALKQLKQMYVNQLDGLGVLLTSKKMYEINPELLGAKATIAHLSLCRGINLSYAHLIAEECYNQDPANPYLRMIYLLSVHLQENAELEKLLYEEFTAAERGIESMKLYFNYFDWIYHVNSRPLELENIPEGYLDLEIEFLKKRVSERELQIVPLEEPVS